MARRPSRCHWGYRCRPSRAAAHAAVRAGRPMSSIRSRISLQALLDASSWFAGSTSSTCSPGCLRCPCCCWPPTSGVRRVDTRLGFGSFRLLRGYDTLRESDGPGYAQRPCFLPPSRVCLTVVRLLGGPGLRPEHPGISCGLSPSALSRCRLATLGLRDSCGLLALAAVFLWAATRSRKGRSLGSLFVAALFHEWRQPQLGHAATR